MKANKIFLFTILSLSMVFGGVVSVAKAATSGTTTTDVTVQSGTLDISNVVSSINLGTVTVDGTIKNITGGLSDLTIADNTGTGNGWNLTVNATPFTETTGATPLTLGSNVFKLMNISSITQTNGSSGLPTSVGTAPWTIDAGAVKVISAAVGNGMGTYDIKFPASALQLSVDTSKKVVDPQNSPTIYQSTVTWQLNVGP